MNLTPDSQAIVLLTCYFDKIDSNKIKPLTVAEWRDFAIWLRNKQYRPSDLLQQNVKQLLADFSHKKITSERLLSLLTRGNAYALALEKWQRVGIWVVTRSDKGYPHLLKKQLVNNAPPVLLGVGNRQLMDNGGLAVIGSRKANNDDLGFTQALGEKAATNNITIVSGAAKGVDETAMLGVLNNGGRAIGVVSDNLMRAATTKKWRAALMDDRLVLLSPFYPEARFNTGNAMARNKYIYCLANAALVVHSGKSGGTISGAKENLKKNWVPLWIKPNQDPESANADLVAKGGRWCAENIEQIDMPSLFIKTTITNAVQKDIFSSNNQISTNSKIEKNNKEINVLKEEVITNNNKKSIENTDETTDKQTDFYQLFLEELKKLAQNEVTVDELKDKTQLHNSQLKEWLKRAVDEKKIVKYSRPIRYQYTKQGSLV